MSENFGTTEVTIERTLDGALFLYAQVASNDPNPLAIEVPASQSDRLLDAQDLLEEQRDVILETTIRISGVVTDTQHEAEFWTIVNTILTVGREQGLE